MNPANIIIAAWKTFDSMPKLPISPTSIPIACTMSVLVTAYNIISTIVPAIKIVSATRELVLIDQMPIGM